MMESAWEGAEGRQGDTGSQPAQFRGPTQAPDGKVWTPVWKGNAAWSGRRPEHRWMTGSRRASLCQFFTKHSPLHIT